MEGEHEGIEESLELQEHSTREFEEEASQLHYMAGVLALRIRTEHLQQGDKNNNPSSSTTGSSNNSSSQVDNVLQQLLAEAEVVKHINDTTTTATATTSNTTSDEVNISKITRKNAE